MEKEWPGTFWIDYYHHLAGAQINQENFKNWLIQRPPPDLKMRKDYKEVIMTTEWKMDKVEEALARVKIWLN